MKEKSILALFEKVLKLSEDPDSIKANPKFAELLTYIAEGWRVGGNFGPGSAINDRDRISVLLAMENAGLSSKRIFGATINLVIEDKISNPNVICTIMHILARFKYKPEDHDQDQLFMQNALIS